MSSFTMAFTGFKRSVSFLWVEGIAIFPFVLIRKGKFNAVLINHESIHLRQQLETGILLFYVWYLTEYLIRLLWLRHHYKAYRAISFEKEAFFHETDLEYLSARRWWSFVKYL